MNKQKYLIITIDTEGDNLWNWNKGDKITTENAKYLQKFQNLCNHFEFKPVWLSNYEMLCDTAYVDFISGVVDNHHGEIGMHLHAWNSEPNYELGTIYKGAPYLTEYPVEIMEAKIEYMTQLIKEKTGIKPVSHRAGRWAINKEYVRLLIKSGYKIDCSITPGINWGKCSGALAGSCGCNYEKFPHEEFWISDETSDDKLLEVPVTICKSHKLYMPKEKTIRGVLAATYRMINGTHLWLRPENDNMIQMIDLISRIENSEEKYIMFMIHSSELMPGGSPTFKTRESIQKLYTDLQSLFERLSQNFCGITLQDYYDINKEIIRNNKLL